MLKSNGPNSILKDTLWDKDCPWLIYLLLTPTLSNVGLIISNNDDDSIKSINGRYYENDNISILYINDGFSMKFEIRILILENPK